VKSFQICRLTGLRRLSGEIVERSLKLRRSAAASWLADSPASRPSAPRACGRIRSTADAPDRSCVTSTCCRRPPGVPCGTSEVIMPTADSSASKEIVTAALLLVIGGKILSGRTKVSTRCRERLASASAM
jgi:hypothetical protein